MLKNYLKIALRSLQRNVSISFINIFGLSVGMAVTMLIGLWIWDEFSYNTWHQNYDRIACVYQRVKTEKETFAFSAAPIPMAGELRKSYPEDFRYVSLLSGAKLTLSYGNNRFTENGQYMEPQGPEMLTLPMESGSRSGLKDPSSILLSASTAKKLFGEKAALDQSVRINNTYTLKVAGVYADPPNNTDFRDQGFIAPWEFYVSNWDWIKAIKNDWGANPASLYVQLNPNADLDKLSAKIAGLKEKNKPNKEYKTEMFLYPMRQWHLYGQFKDGVHPGGLITYVRLFGTIGLFVLLLACINFINLSTARSERRAKEVGIRKAIGSLRGQLIGQFFSESILIVFIAFAISLVIVRLMLPWFNEVADKQLSIPLGKSGFWLAGIGFILFTSLLAGCYPALYLSSLKPIKVLKGTFRLGRLAAVPRQVLVVLQFTISILLTMGTTIVYRQIKYAKDRPVGYDREGLISIQETTPEIYKNYNVLHNELLRTGVAVEMSESQGPITDIWSGSDGFDWQGKPSNFKAEFAVIGIRHEYGKTVGWQFVKGRDFSRAFATDSNGLVVNETAAKYMGVKYPVGLTIHWKNQPYKVIGVIRDMIMASPYEQVPQSVYCILKEGGNFINVRINPHLALSDALKQMELIFRKYNPAAPFDYSFVDQEYAKKFSAEELVGKLSAFFSILAILISCLGLFGLASFVAEQRIKEISIRKVLGASVLTLWRLLSKDFALLVVLSQIIAMPIAWYFMVRWLRGYTYHAAISWWIFAGTGLGAMLITLLTVSYQSIKAALTNPAKILRSE